MKKVLPLIMILLLISVYGYYDLITNSDFVIQKTVTENNLAPVVYFTSKTNVTKIIVDMIKDSKETKCAFYDLDNELIINLLKEKKANVTIEDKNALDEFHFGYSSKSMHNKFCVFDNKTVLTGSLNPTQRGLYKNDNNVIIIYSKYIARNYLDEFDELINEKYGSGKKVKYPKVTLNQEIDIENYFCPEDNCQDKVLKKLDEAKESIYFMTFSFTDQKIADKLIQKQNEGVEVSGVMEKQRINMNYNKFKTLNKTIEMVPDKNRYVMHHKVFIIDNQIVITGSYNPTISGAFGNDENIIIISNMEVAKKYLEEFERLKNG